MKANSSPSVLPQAVLLALLIVPLVGVLWVNGASVGEAEPTDALAKSFQVEIQNALVAAYGSSDATTTCSMHGNVNFGVTCRAPLRGADAIVAQFLASGWSYAEDSTPSTPTLRRSNRRIYISELQGTGELSISMRLVKS
jgi:hypothetical protein